MNEDDNDIEMNEDDNDKKYSLEEIRNFDLCSTKIPDNTLKYLNSIKNTKEFNKYKSIFLKKNLWNKNKIIIKFIGVPYDCSSDQVENKEDTLKTIMNLILKVDGRNAAKVDPLQNEFYIEYNKIIFDITTSTEIKIEKIRVLLQTYVKKVIKDRFEPICGLDFDFDNNVPNTSDILISFVINKPNKSFYGIDSLNSVGDIYKEYNDGNKKVEGTLNLGTFSISIIMHEFGHAIGLLHEHQNSCGFTPKWNKELIYTYYLITSGWDTKTVDENIINLSQYDIMSSYDPKSIMIYSYSSNLTLNGIGTEQNYTLSPNDVLYINKIYPKVDMTYSKLVSWYNSVYGTDKWIIVPGTNVNLMNNENKFNYLMFIIVVVVVLLVGILLAIHLIKKMRSKT